MMSRNDPNGRIRISRIVRKFISTMLTGILLLPILTSFAGCRKDRGMEKVIVEGDVSYVGQPIVNGDIKFYPVEGTPGPVSGASIKDGHYIVKNKDGVPVGKHMVQIRAFDVSQGSGVDDDLISAGRAAKTSKSARGQYIPRKYNRDTELSIEVTKKSKSLDFDLEE